MKPSCMSGKTRLIEVTSNEHTEDSTRSTFSNTVGENKPNENDDKQDEEEKNQLQFSFKQLKDFKVGDKIKGFDSNLNPTNNCKVKAVGKSYVLVVYQNTLVKRVTQLTSFLVFNSIAFTISQLSSYSYV